MSVDLVVIPSVPRPMTWGCLKQSLLRHRFSDTAAALVGSNPRLMRTANEEELKEGAQIAIGDHLRFQLARDNTLTLAYLENDDSCIDELEYIEDFGRNLEFDTQLLLAKRWKSVGSFYSCESWGGRAAGELELLAGLASALARLCDGHLVIKDDAIFDHPIGVYSSEVMITEL